MFLVAASNFFAARLKATYAKSDLATSRSRLASTLSSILTPGRGVRIERDGVDAVSGVIAGIETRHSKVAGLGN